MKLQSKKNKRIIIAIIAITAVLLIIGGIIAIMLLDDFKNPSGNYNPPTPDTTTSIKMSFYPKTKYYVGEDFDPTGLTIEVKQNGALYFVDYKNPKLQVSGFDSSVPNESLTITVTYEGLTTNFSVEIKEVTQVTPEKKLESISVSDNFKKSYSLNRWNTTGPNFNNVYLVLHYSDGTTEEIPGVRQYVQDLILKFDSACTYDMIVKYNYAGTEYTITVPITITN